MALKNKLNDGAVVDTAAAPEHHPAVRRRATTLPASRAPTMRKDLRSWSALAIVAVIGAFFGQFGTAIYEFLDHLLLPAPPLAAVALNDAITQAYRQGFELVGGVHTIDFRPGGPASKLIILRPKDPYSALSDEVRIYDVVDNHLVLDFAFRPQPAASRQENANVGTPRTTVLPEARSFSLQLRAVANFDGVAGNQVLLDISDVAVQPTWPRPVLIYWNAVTGRYALTPLLSPTTTGRPTMRGVISMRYLRRGDWVRSVIEEIYTRPTTIVNADDPTERISTYAMQAYVYQRKTLAGPRGEDGGDLDLTAGYVVRGASFGVPALLQAVTWTIDLNADPITARTLSATPTVLRVGVQVSHLQALLAAASR
jgi:hypothetical protein